jgi:ketosteroid isomerase-like protein/catechol 2,3-dioxygenase-like lactoylglutathione lyase family enzyme
VSTSNTNLDVVLGGWIDALRRGDLETAERHLHPDATWQGVRADLVCPDRAHMLEVVAETGRNLPEVEGIELAAEGDQVLLGVRSPDLTEIGGEPLDGELFSVFTIRDGLIVRVEDFKTRDEAADAMRAHGGAEVEPLARTPAAPAGGLVPFVHVADVERSVRFYELLGFAVSDTYRLEDRLDWASLESGDARLMLAFAHEPVDPARQAVLFYLYSDDLRDLQRHLRAHGVRAGQIRDGSPGPREEMCVRDPDGYVLMIAQT